MPPSQRPVWTTTKKITGNVLPLVLASPLLYKAIETFGKSGVSVELILWGGGFLLGSWLFLAAFGLFGNSSMRREVGRRLHIERPFDQTDRVFVGFARPAFKSSLDPHEDVGFLIFHEDRLEFWGAEHKVALDRGDVVGSRFRPNTHSLVGLGRWISIEAVVEGRPVRLLVEPREKFTLLGNLVFSKRLLAKVRDWKGEGPPANAGGPSESSDPSSGS